jgi:hypothetical protein
VTGVALNGSEHVVDVMPPSVISHGHKHLLLDSDGRHTVGVLVALYQERIYVVADWCESSAPGLVIPNLVRSARAVAGGVVAAHAKPDHFGSASPPPQGPPGSLS